MELNRYNDALNRARDPQELRRIGGNVARFVLLMTTSRGIAIPREWWYRPAADNRPTPDAEGADGLAHLSLGAAQPAAERAD